jgi:hypothetical protein
MLRRNQLIAPEDVARLERWMDRIETVSVRILGSGDVAAAFADDAAFGETDGYTQVRPVA